MNQGEDRRPAAGGEDRIRAASVVVGGRVGGILVARPSTYLSRTGPTRLVVLMTALSITATTSARTLTVWLLPTAAGVAAVLAHRHLGNRALPLLPLWRFSQRLDVAHNDGRLSVRVPGVRPGGILTGDRLVLTGLPWRGEFVALRVRDVTSGETFVSPALLWLGTLVVLLLPALIAWG